EGILAVDRDRRVLLSNRALGNLLNLRGIAPVPGLPLIEIVRDHAILAAFDTVLESGETVRTIVRAGMGVERTFELAVTPLLGGEGSRGGALAVFFDVTRLTALENVRREFVADVSHELRTPLTSIRAFVETLLAGGIEDNSNNRRFLEIIKKHSD